MTLPCSITFYSTVPSSSRSMGGRLYTGGRIQRHGHVTDAVCRLVRKSSVYNSR